MFERSRVGHDRVLHLICDDGTTMCDLRDMPGYNPGTPPFESEELGALVFSPAAGEVSPSVLPPSTVLAEPTNAARRVTGSWTQQLSGTLSGRCASIVTLGFMDGLCVKKKCNDGPTLYRIE